MPPFEKQFKRFLKKYKSLNDDLAVLKEVIQATPAGNGTKHWQCVHVEESWGVYKMRMTCRSLAKGKDFRVVYGYFPLANKLELVDLYWKGEQDNEDFALVKEYMKSKKR